MFFVFATLSHASQCFCVLAKISFAHWRLSASIELFFVDYNQDLCVGHVPFLNLYTNPGWSRPGSFLITICSWSMLRLQLQFITSSRLCGPEVMVSFVQDKVAVGGRPHRLSSTCLLYGVVAPSVDSSMCLGYYCFFYCPRYRVVH